MEGAGDSGAITWRRARERASAPVRAARRRATKEERELRAERTAYDRFRQTVADLDVDAPTTASGGTAAGGLATVTSMLPSVGGSSATCEDVRGAFAETVRPHSVADVQADESLLATIRAELGDDLAVALAAGTDVTFDAALRSSILETVDDRLVEIDAVLDALEREVASLEAVADHVIGTVDWLAAVDSDPLDALSFDALRARHADIAAKREATDDVAADRQSFLRARTAGGVDCDVAHDGVSQYLHGADTYPALDALARTSRVLDDCQRAVRAHLARRA
jgi:hypothetical protein